MCNVRKNTRLILNQRHLLFVALLVVVQLAACSSSEERKEKYLDRAQQHFSSGNYTKAKLEIKNALQIDPKNVKGWYLFAQISEKQKELKEAFGAYNRVVELAPEHFEASLELAKFYVLGNRPQAGKKHLDKVLIAQPNNIRARILEAEIMAREGREAVALASLEEIFSNDATQARAAQLMALLYVRQNKLDLAEETLTNAIEANPEDTAVRLTLADVLFKAERPQDTERLLKELVKLEPEKLVHRARLAALYTRLNRFDDAEKVLRTPLVDDNDDVSRSLLLTEFLMRQRGSQEAEAELKKNIAAQPEVYELQFALAKLYEVNKNWTLAKLIYKQIIEANEEHPRAISAKIKLAAAFVEQGNTVQASTLLTETLKRSPGDIGALFIRGEMALKQGRFENAVADLRIVAKGRPNSAEVLKLLARANAMSGETELAKTRLKEAVNSNPEDGALRFAYVETLVGLREYDAALGELKEILQLASGHPKALKQKMALHILKKEWESAEQTAKQLAAVQPDSKEGAYGLAQVLANQKKYTEAEAIFSNILKTESSDLKATEGLSKLYLIQGKKAAAIELIKQQIKNYPNNPALYVSLGKIYRLDSIKDARAFERSKQNYEQAIKIKPEWQIPYIELAALYIVHKQNKSAEQIYKRGLKVIPESIDLQLLLAGLYEKNGNVAAAKHLYEAILNINNNHLVARNNLAVILSDETTPKGLARAMKLAKPFAKAKNPLLLDTLGWIHYKNADYEQAVFYLTSAAEKLKKNATIQYHLGMAHYKSGNHELAKKYLKNALALGEGLKGRDEVRNILAELS